MSNIIPHYIYINRLKAKDGCYRSYRLFDGSAEHVVSDVFIKEGLRNKTIEVDGLFLTKDNRLMLEKTKDSEIEITNIVSNQPRILSFTGQGLINYVDSQLVGKPHKRDFVDKIVKYMSVKSDLRVLGISGLRGVGKTTGLLQGIKQINDFDNTVYILLTKMENSPAIQYSELYDYIKAYYDDKKYVFIDEITFCKNFVTGSATLYDDFTSNGKKVVICGTDSYALAISRRDALYHRIFLLNVTFISYMESVRTVGIRTIKDYIELGGLYNSDVITDIDGLREYIDTSVINNIMNTLYNNGGALSLNGLKQYKNNPDKLRTIVYAILCAIVYKASHKNKNLSISFITELFNHSDLFDKEQLREYICGALELDSELSFRDKDVIPILNVLQKIHLIESITNIYDTDLRQYYITNQSIFNQLATLLVQAGKNVGDIIKSATIKRKHGFLLESAIVNHTLVNAKKYGYTIYYYHDKDNKEIDLVIGKKIDANDDDFSLDDKYILCEVKLTSDRDIAVAQSTWINSPSISIDGTVLARYIIYTGKTGIFNNFISDDVCTKGKISIEEIEAQNKGILVLSAKDYLTDMQKYLNILEK